MSKYFKLIRAIDTITTLNVASQKEGVTTYSHVRLKPGEKYELGDDKVFNQSLQNIQIERPYSQQLVKELMSLGVEYTESACKSCGGRIKKISYAAVEIIEE
ncbi:hypothetical protein JZO73_09975 [Enterococcus plantarum]|uniref:Uncharacterized protein n=1 Tax=Enterococcus plantarum TaxID=1077675 RepID=A0A2W3Z788_9ENTE|nr:hypothetical protein [Enterococcus plantarum]MBO0467857.1 hypothetical protein [Enterococcus plantarum]PZL69944.1 hypothetical protein CI088_16990 [Enterococcus plantarum]